MNAENLRLAVELRRQLHTHPELSCQETWTKRHLMVFLRRHTKLEVVDKGRWFYAVYRSGVAVPGIAFRADFDAVAMDEYIDLPYGSQFPGVAHKCGHDGHSAGLAAFALEVDQNGAGQDIFFLFQHAEETGEGALECQVLLDTENISEIFGYHNMPGYPLHSIVVKDGVMQCASQGMTITLEGAPAHASQPEDGKNPALAIARLIQAIPDIIEPSQYQGLVLCTVVHAEIGAPRFGVAAHRGSLSVTCRGQFQNEMDAVRDKLCAAAQAQATKEGLTCDFSYQEDFPETANHPQSSGKVRACAQKLGYDLRELEQPLRGSEDFGHYTQKKPGAYFYIGAGGVSMPHTMAYDFPDAILETGVEMFKALAGIC